ncbi:MAG TPA: hypothetical protein VGL46_03315 [Pseudonocardiaceae bacterium]
MPTITITDATTAVIGPDVICRSFDFGSAPVGRRLPVTARRPLAQTRP